MLLSRKRLHKIRQTKNQSMKHKKGKKRRRKRNKSFSKKRKSFNLRNKSLKIMKGGNAKGMKFFFLMPFSITDLETKVALVGIKSKKKADQIKRKFAKSFSVGFTDNLLVNVVTGLKDKDEVDGYTKLHTFSLTRESKDEKIIKQEIEMLHALNHSLFQLQNSVNKEIKGKNKRAHLAAIDHGTGKDPCEQHKGRKQCNNKTENGKDCNWSISDRRCRTGIPKGSINIYERVKEHVEKHLFPGRDVVVPSGEEGDGSKEQKRVSDETPVVVEQPAIQLPESKQCDSKRDCGDKFCLQPPEGGTGKCVPKQVYISNMKSRKGPKEAPAEASVEGVADMFKEPEVQPAIQPEVQPAIQLPETKQCESKRDCGDKFCLQPPEGGTGKCVPKEVYISNMKSRKGPKEEAAEANMEGVADMFKDPEPPLDPSNIHPSWRGDNPPGYEPVACKTDPECVEKTNGGRPKCKDNICVTQEMFDAGKTSGSEEGGEKGGEEGGEKGGEEGGEDVTIDPSTLPIAPDGPVGETDERTILKERFVVKQNIYKSGQEEFFSEKWPLKFDLSSNNWIVVTPAGREVSFETSPYDITSGVDYDFYRSGSIIGGDHARLSSVLILGPFNTQAEANHIKDNMQRQHNEVMSGIKNLPVAPGGDVPSGDVPVDPSAVVTPGGDVPVDPSTVVTPGGDVPVDPSALVTPSGDVPADPSAVVTPGGDAPSSLNVNQNNNSGSRGTASQGNKESSEKSFKDPVKYHQPWFQVRGQVYPGPYQPGFKIVGDTGVNFMPWLRHLGQPNPFAHYDGGPVNTNKGTDPSAPPVGKEEEDDEKTHAPMGGGKKKKKKSKKRKTKKRKKKKSYLKKSRKRKSRGKKKKK